MLPAFDFRRAADLDQAIALLQADGSRLHAGGTDLLGCLQDGVFGAERLVSISGLDGLRRVQSDKGGLRIGALVTIAEVAEQPQIASRYPGLAQAAAAVASPQLRNQGTLGGNLCQKPRCWYYRGEFDCLRKGGRTCFAHAGDNRFHCILGGRGCVIVHPSDTAPALIALDARVRIQGPKGSRRIAVADLHVPPADDFLRETMLEPGEIITHIELPEPVAGSSSRYRKVRARRAWDFALAGAALSIKLRKRTVEHLRLVFSGVAPVPWRAERVEQQLIGNTLDAAAIERAAATAVEEADPLEHNGYKVELLEAVVTQELGACASG